MVDEDDGGVKPPLQVTEVPEQSGDFGRAVFIQAVQSHQRVEYYDLRLQCLDSLRESFLVFGLVEAQGWRGDDV